MEDSIFEDSNINELPNDIEEGHEEGQLQENIQIKGLKEEVGADVDVDVDIDIDIEEVDNGIFIKEESNGDALDDAVIDGVDDDEDDYEVMDDEEEEEEEGEEEDEGEIIEEDEEEIDPFEGIGDVDTKLSMIMKTLKSQNKLIQILLERTQGFDAHFPKSTSSSSSSSSLNNRHNLLGSNAENRLEYNTNNNYNNMNDSDMESEETILDYTEDNRVKAHRKRTRPIMRPSYLTSHHRPRRVCLFEGCGIDIMNRGSRARYCEYHSKILRSERAKAHNMKAREDRAIKALPRRCTVCSVDISNRGVRALYCELHSIHMNKPKPVVQRVIKTRVCAQPGCGITFTLRHGYYRTLYCDDHRILRARTKTTTTVPRTACLVKVCAKKGCTNKFEINGVGKGKGSYRTKYCLDHRTNANKRDFSSGTHHLYNTQNSNLYKRSRHHDSADGDLEVFMQRRIDSFLNDDDDDDMVASADFLDDGFGTHIPHTHFNDYHNPQQQQPIQCEEIDEIEELDESIVDTTNNTDSTVVNSHTYVKTELMSNDHDQTTMIDMDDMSAMTKAIYDPFMSTSSCDPNQISSSNGDTNNTILPIENGSSSSINVEAHYGILSPAHATAVPVRVPI